MTSLSFSFHFYFLILIGLILNGVSSQHFDSLPAFNIQTNYGKGSAVKISPNSLKIAVGFQYGSVAVYDTAGSLLYGCFGHTNHIIDIEWINDNEFISIDSMGKAIRWNEEGKQIIIWQLKENVKDISVTTNNNQNYLAVNLGSSVMQFNADVQSDASINRYFPSHGSSIDRIIYDKGHHMLFTATNTSLILAYSCQSGQMMPLIPIHTSYPILCFELMPNGYIAALTSNNFLIKFSTQLQFTSTDLYTPGSMMTVCPTGQSTNLFLISSKINGTPSSKTVLKVFSQQVKLQQELVNYTGDDSLIKGMDCSKGGLALINDQGFLKKGKYHHADNRTKNGNWWWILLIAITGLSFVVGLIMAIKRTKHKFTLIRKKSVHSHYAIIDETNLIKTNDLLEKQSSS